MHLKEYLKEYEWNIVKGFQEKLSYMKEGTAADIREKIMAQEDNTSLALQYLYAASPLSDIGNYSFETYLDFAEHGIALRRQSPFADKIPPLIFLQYVLHHRVNEEEIEACRSFFYRQLKDEVADLTMDCAAIAVNYWCAGEATYQCSDDRTASAMTVYRTARGRCGEESTFTVNAMRSVGIPARQVYAPRWSHCDDNHAWVEVWCNGQWYFLGACEPEVVVNRGWFVGASSRAMLEHSRWFGIHLPLSSGHLEGTDPSEEEMAGTSGMAGLFNQTKRYANTGKLEVKTEDERGLPISGVLVRLEVLNYAELFPVAELVTDETGTAALTVGLGSIVAEAENNGCYDAAVIDVTAGGTQCILTLKKQKETIFWGGGAKWKEFDFYAPADAPRYHIRIVKELAKMAKQELDARNAHRLAKGDTENAKQIELFLQAGNLPERIGGGMRINPRQVKEAREKFLAALSEKDMLDAKAIVLEEHFIHALAFYDQYPENIFYNYVANPRIHLEVLTCWRSVIDASFTAVEKQSFGDNPSCLWRWIKEHIKEHPAQEYDHLITTPSACISTGSAGKLSQQVLFTAVLRTLGIPARLNPKNLAPEYYRNGSFVPLHEDEREDCVLRLRKDPAEIWNYSQNYTLGRFTEGRFETQRLTDLEFVQNSMSVSLTPGTYRLITTNRLPNGNSFAAAQTFALTSGENKEIELYQRRADLKDMLEDIALPEFALQAPKGGLRKASDVSGQGTCIYFFLEEGKEPTEHILNELIERAASFSSCGAKLIFVTEGKNSLIQTTLKHCLQKLPNIEVYFGQFEELIPVLARGMYVDPEKLPLMILTSGGLRGIFGTSGYNVGTADMLLKVIEALG